MAKRKLSGTDVLRMIDEQESSDTESDYIDEEFEDDEVSDTDVDDDSGDADDAEPSSNTWKEITGMACNVNRLPFTVVHPGSTLTDDLLPSDVIGLFQLFFTDDLIAQFVTNTLITRVRR